MNERRQSDRKTINYPIIYAASDTAGRLDSQGIGVALDISADGMMFESNEPVDAMILSIRASYNNGETIKVDGLLVYSMPHTDGKYRSGVRFSGDADQVSLFVSQISRHSAG